MTQDGQAEQAGVYERLRRAILSLELLPGAPVSERALEPLLGASRTPIREAMLRLTSEGLVQRDGRSHRVAPIDLDELMEAFEYREHIEAAVARILCERPDPEGMARLQAALDGGLGDDSPETWFGIGVDIHTGLARLTGNRFLARAAQDVATRISRARWLMVSLPEARAAAHEEHSRILRLIAEVRAEEAVAAVIAHSRDARDTLAAAIRQSRNGLRVHGVAVIG